MNWLRGPEASLHDSLNWYLRTGSTRIYHMAVMEGGQGRRWFWTRCGRLFYPDKITVLQERNGPPKYGRLCRLCAR